MRGVDCAIKGSDMFNRYEGPCGEIASSTCFKATVMVDYASWLLFS